MVSPPRHKDTNDQAKAFTLGERFHFWRKVSLWALVPLWQFILGFKRMSLCQGKVHIPIGKTSQAFFEKNLKYPGPTLQNFGEV
jgi:hypothetical protein